MMGDTCCIFWKRCLLLPLLIICCQFCFTQRDSIVSIQVNEGSNEQPLTGAIVKIVPLTNTKQAGKFIAGLTDNRGKYYYNFNEFEAPVTLTISYLGFVTISDTLYEAYDKRYTLTELSKNIQDVVVTGQYSTNSLKNSMNSMRVISADNIAAKGATNLREALQNELHIDLGQDQIFGSSLGINGISGEGVKIMVDGVPIVGRLDGKLDLSQINISNIERIEIVEGPLSVQYGTDAMGGVVNIITKNFQQEKVNLNLKGYYETVGQYNAELNSGFVFGKSEIFLSGGRNFFSGFTTLDSLPRYKEWKPKEQYFADAKYIFNGNRFRVSLLGSFFREYMISRSAPQQTLSYDNGDTSWTYTGNDEHFFTYRPRASFSLMYKFREDYQLDFLAAYTGFIRLDQWRTKNLVTLKENLVANDSVLAPDTARYHQILVRSTYTMPAWKNKLNFQFGIEVNQEFVKQNRIETGKQQRGDYAAFGSVRINLVKGFDVQPAVRFSYNTRFQTPIIPSLNLKYNWNDKVIARVSYGMGYRAPTIKEMFLEFYDINHRLQGNPDLKPERGHTVNASVDYSTNYLQHNFMLSFSGFYNNIQNKIDWLFLPGALPGTDTFQYFNLKSYVTYGGDVAFSYKWKSLQFNASVLFTGFELSNSLSGIDKVKMQSVDFTAGASYTIPVALITLHANYKYTDAKPLFSINSSIQTGTRAAYHMLNISASRNFWKNRIQITVGGKNLVGVKNVLANNVSSVGHNTSGNDVNIGWGRTFFTTLVLHFGK